MKRATRPVRGDCVDTHMLARDPDGHWTEFARDIGIEDGGKLTPFNIVRACRAHRALSPGAARLA
jgi:hypothetical protein